MSLCSKCNDLIQSAAANSIEKKKNALKKSGYDESDFGKVLTDPFVIMWVPEPEKPPQPPKYYPPNPNCIEYDCIVDMNTGAQECRRRVYPVKPRKPKNDFP